MKFANIVMTRKGRITIGDDVQLLAIENLYRYMGIDYNDVVRIPFNELSTYDGEYVVLPISFPLFAYSHDTAITQYSNKIIPVFLGMAILTTELSNKEVAYLKKYEPIGCRDQFTLEVLRKYNIVCYLNGCMTATLPKRDKDIVGDKIFCIDVPDDFKKFIPQNLLDQCHFSNHVYMSDECPNGSEAKAKEIYKMYRREARLIITTRLHAALPCLAMGIPVVLAKDKLSYRFAILSNLIHIYSKDEFDAINWNPEPVDYELLKNKILSLCQKRVLDAYNKYHDMYELSEFFESDTSTMNYFEAITDAIDYLNEHYNCTDEFKYCLWGITQTAEMIYKFVETNFPKAKLVGVIDQKKKIEFCGILSTDKTWLENKKDVLCLVCAPAAMPEAREYFDTIKHSKYLLCWSDNLPR